MFDNFPCRPCVHGEGGRLLRRGWCLVARLYRDAPTWALEEHVEGYEFDTYIARADLARRAIKALLLARWADHQAGYSAPVRERYQEDSPRRGLAGSVQHPRVSVETWR